MSDFALTEEPLQFGEGGRLLGILTLPSVPLRNSRELPVFVFFNAGALHRVGPHRLYVRLARDLSRRGFSTLRVDLAGKGDSAPRHGLTVQQSVAADHDEILSVLEARLGPVPLILGGLCSGADNAVRLTPSDSRVVGMVLLDPICFPDAGFTSRARILKYTNTARYVAWMKGRFEALISVRTNSDERVDPLSLRDPPTREQLQSAFESIRQREGRVLAVFTEYALPYYNQAGQLSRVLNVTGYQQFCTELFWPQAEHTYTLDLHRRQLSEAVTTWAEGYIRP